MSIYFLASTSGLPKFEGNYRQIIKTLNSLGFDIANNWIISRLKGSKSYKNSDEAVKNETHLLAQADLVIADISVPSFGVGYFIKQALVQRKRVLCLYPDNLDTNTASEIFLGNTSNLLKVEYYNTKNLKNILKQNLSNPQLNDLVKFNFLVTSEIEEYLDWASDKTKQSRSEFLREAIIKKIINEDEEYQQFQKRIRGRKRVVKK